MHFEQNAASLNVIRKSYSVSLSSVVQEPHPQPPTRLRVACSDVPLSGTHPTNWRFFNYQYLRLLPTSRKQVR